VARSLLQLVAQTPIKAPAPQDIELLPNMAVESILAPFMRQADLCISRLSVAIVNSALLFAAGGLIPNTSAWTLSEGHYTVSG
jgi:hypothetical protein